MCLQVMIRGAFRNDVLIFNVCARNCIFRITNTFVFTSSNSFLNVTRMLLKSTYSFQTRNDKRRRNITLLQRVNRGNISTIYRSRIRRFIHFIRGRILCNNRKRNFTFRRIRRSSQYNCSSICAPFRNTCLTFSKQTSVCKRRSRTVNVFEVVIRITYCLRAGFTNKTRGG